MLKMHDIAYPEYRIHQISCFMDSGQFIARVYWLGHTEANPKWSQVRGQEAINLIIKHCPELLEGNPELKFIKYSWVFHNLIAHPLMQLLFFFGFKKLGLKIHDITIPKP